MKDVSLTTDSDLESEPDDLIDSISDHFEKMIDTAINLVEEKLARSSWPSRWHRRCQVELPGARSADAGGPAEDEEKQQQEQEYQQPL